MIRESCYLSFIRDGSTCLEMFGCGLKKASSISDSPVSLYLESTSRIDCQSLYDEKIPDRIF